MKERSRDKSLLLLYFYHTDAIEELKNPPTIPDDTPTTANERYDSTKYLGTWRSISDVDTFLSRFSHANDYKDGDVELALGNYVTIEDGTYNVDWMIAGFDMEHNQTAADGNKYDNGVGICLIPKTQVTTAAWNKSNTITGAYNSSTMHNTHLPNIVTKLKNVLGSHIVQRNVLLSSSVDGGNEYSNAYTWTTAYATLMSAGQMTGTFAANHNKYDDGEANYKLPIFNHTGYKTGSGFWSRGVWGNTDGRRYYAWFVDSSGIDFIGVTAAYGGRPLIYLR